ncbi:SHOCT domain-containing protein [Cellulomonas sp. APG4]|uniref:SHOCT domain-containing protein n=1 Tax=Cellulomonas sp. APG4 TaxID=1538656 RepID=UPI001ED96914|nr:SHOCT domain-containing protein [Cellulomonas sp. APG4]
MMRSWNGMGMGMGMGMGWSWVFGLLLLAGVVTLVVLLVRLTVDGGRRRGEHPGPGAAQSRAREVLDERYARGEIDSAEYEERLRTLRRDP